MSYQWSRPAEGQELNGSRSVGDAARAVFPDADLQHGSSPDGKWVGIGIVLGPTGSIVALTCRWGVSATRRLTHAAPARKRSRHWNHSSGGSFHEAEKDTDCIGGRSGADEHRVRRSRARRF